MKAYISRQDAEAVLAAMKHLSEHDVFVLEVDNSSGIGSTITLTVDIIHNNLAGKFTTEVCGVENW